MLKNAQEARMIKKTGLNLNLVLDIIITTCIHQPQCLDYKLSITITPNQLQGEVISAIRKISPTVKIMTFNSFP